MKILNLYACLGGNRYKWDEVAKEAGIEIEVTAVEWDEELARLYQERFPNDKVIVADAHEFLRLNFKDYDFIWSSPPCPSHSRARAYNPVNEVIYPDMKLYEEIILLNLLSTGVEQRFKGKFVIENVIPYYDPLIPGQKRGRHLYWSNFNIPMMEHRESVKIGNSTKEVLKWCDFHDYDFYKYKGKQPVQKIARNLVDYEAGRTIFETALGIIKKKNVNQVSIFDHIEDENM